MHLVQERVDHAARQQEEQHRQREEQGLRPAPAQLHTCALCYMLCRHHEAVIAFSFVNTFLTCNEDQGMGALMHTEAVCDLSLAKARGGPAGRGSCASSARRR